MTRTFGVISKSSARSRLQLAGSASLAALAIAGVGVWSAPARAEPAAAASGESEVVVTGSRITRRDFTASSPVVTVNTESLQNTSAISIDQQLNKLPQFVPGQNQFTSAGDVQATPTSSPGAATVNLRGLGTNRNLVLVDGRRFQPVNANLVVDINTIPAAAIDSIEIVSGGAAATYGADALAGVVNFKLRKNYHGVEVDAQYGETFRGDGSEFRVTALLGGNFGDDKGNALIAFSYGKRDPVLQADRPFYTRAWTDPGVAGGDFFPDAPGFNIIPYTGFTAFGPNVPSQAAINSIFVPQGFAAGDVSPFNGIYFNRAANPANATVFAVNAGLVSGKPAPGYTGPLYPHYKILANGNLATNPNNQLLSLPLTRYSIFANGYYNFNENITGFLQGNFVETSTRTALGGFVPAVNQWGVSIPYDAAHPVPAQLATLLNSRPDPAAPWQLNQELSFLGPRSLATTATTYQVLGGFRGTIPGPDWTWELYGTHGRTSTVTVYHGFADQARYQALIALPNYGAGADFNNGLIGRLAHCTSGLNPFSTAAVSQDCVDIVQSLLKTTTDLQQDVVEFNLQGSLFNLPAGPLKFAVGADYRKDAIEFLPDPAMSKTNITSTSLGIFDAAPVNGSQSVFEGYGELLVPVIKDMPFAKEVRLELGYRYSSYDTATGGVSTWKTLAYWSVNDWLQFRGGYQRANRAPNTAELFQPNTVLVTLWPDSDPCANTTIAPYGNLASNPNRAKVQALCTTLSHGFPITNSFGGLGFYFPLALDQQVGNTALQSEDGRTWTVGAVVKSPFTATALRNFTASVDYYNYNITGAIVGLTSQIVYAQCLNANGSSNPSYDPNNAYCQLIHRSAAGATDTVVGLFSNLGSIQTSGIDAQVDWSVPTPDFGVGEGNFYVNFVMNWLHDYRIQTAPGSPVVDYAGSTGFDASTGAQFKWKTFTTVGYSVGPANVSLRWRHLPSVKNAAKVGNPASTVHDTAAYNEFDLSARYAVSSHWILRAGIENLGDTEPPIVGANPPITTNTGFTDPGNYDTLGRRFYIGLTARF